MDSSPAEVPFDRFSVRPYARQVVVGGEAVALGARAFDLLMALLERRDRVVGKHELLDIVWPGLVVEENNLQVQISALRKTLGVGAIATIPGRGYRFTADGPSACEAAAPPQAAPLMAGNLPLRPPAMFGRGAELVALLDMLRAHALVTVVGAGGMGKTTIALAAAAALRESFASGVWFVELAPVTDPTQLANLVAETLGLELSGTGVAALQQLSGRIVGQRMLIVLDNCEHLVDAAGALAEAVLNRAPGVRLLVTSQELLNIPGERTFKLDALSLPGPAEVADTARHGAVALFVERACAADPHFALAPDNAGAVADICRSLDGLPLAIELAAARVRLLGVHGLRDKIGERFRVLTGGSRTALRKHQTLRATLDWSHALLAAPERAVLRRLGVFVGGFSLELAQRVAKDDACDEWAVLDALSILVDKSLVSAEGGEPPRYRLLETTRAYALERLAEAGETTRWLDHHLHAVRDFFVQTAQMRYDHPAGLTMPAMMARLGPEIDNLRAALDWACGSGADTASAVALVAAGVELFSYAGRSLEGLTRMLSLRPHLAMADPQHAAAFWLGLATLGNSGRLPRDELLEAEARAVQAYRALGPRRRLTNALCNQAATLGTMGQLDAAEAALAEARDLEQADDPPGLHMRMVCVSAVLAWERQHSEAALHLLRSEEARFLGLPGQAFGLFICRIYIAITLNLLGRHQESLSLADTLIEQAAPQGVGDVGYVAHCKLVAEIGLGRTDAARRTLRSFLGGWRHDGMLRPGAGDVAHLLAESGRWSDAARLDGVSQAHERHSGSTLGPRSTRLRQMLLQRFAAAGLAETDLERWRREGEALDDADIADLYLDAAAAAP